MQHIPHDIFDRDAVLTGIATLKDGSQVIISTGKLGRVIGLDPDGAVLWDTPVGIHQNDDLTEFEGEIEVLPGNAGGVVTPMAVADGMVYVSVVNVPTTYKPDVPEGTGTSLGVHPSQLVAIDASNGEIIWDTELPGDSFGGATVVNDLVFTSVITGVILALDRETGEIVWGHQASRGHQRLARRRRRHHPHPRRLRRPRLPPRPQARVALSSEGPSHADLFEQSRCLYWRLTRWLGQRP